MMHNLLSWTSKHAWFDGHRLFCSFLVVCFRFIFSPVTFALFKMLLPIIDCQIWRQIWCLWRNAIQWTFSFVYIPHLKPRSHSHGTRRRISYGQNLKNDRGKSGWSWLIRIQYGYRTVLLRIITENQGQFAKLVIIDCGMIRFNTLYYGHDTI